MLAQTIISLTVITGLTLAMSFLLAKVVRKMNKRADEYFEKKITVYDDLIDEKQKYLDAIEKRIEDKESRQTLADATEHKEKDSNGNNLLVVNEKMPEYKIEDFFEQAKTIDEKFKFNKEAAIRDFINGRTSHENETRMYGELEELYNKLCEVDRYELIVKNLNTGWDYVSGLMSEELKGFLKSYMVGSPNADINEIVSYVKLEMDKVGTNIVVETGDKDDNFDYINNRVKTVYNPDIYMGIRIFYQDKMYDYSLGGAI